jgi:hypothetical protein
MRQACNFQFTFLSRHFCLYICLSRGGGDRAVPTQSAARSAHSKAKHNSEHLESLSLSLEREIRREKEVEVNSVTAD